MLGKNFFFFLADIALENPLYKGQVWGMATEKFTKVPRAALHSV